MKLTVKKAREMLEEVRGKMPDDHWTNHSICVGNSAGKIAERLNLNVFIYQKRTYMKKRII